MAGQLPWNPSQYEVVRDAASIHVPEEPQSFAPKWYFSKQELEYYSPSRKDGISHVEESHLRELYCSFLQELGMELKVPQMTIATAMMFCHRFYMRQSHAKNCWRIMATVCMFLACKAEETSRWLADVVVVAYKMTYKWDPSAPRRIRQKEVYDKQKELTLNGERFLLTTLAFDMNIEHPYKPLVGALKRLEISDKELIKVAWNFVNDWLRTTLCLQYRPHYVAAGSLFLAAKICKVKLPKEKGQVWWMQFDVSPKHVEEVVQQMMALLDQYRKQAPPQSVAGKGTAPQPIAGKTVSSSPQSCTLSGSAVNIEMANDSVSSKYLGNEKKTCSDVPNPTPKETGPHCQANDSGSADSVVEDCEAEKSNLNASSKIVSVEGGNANKVDVNWEQSQQPIPGQITSLEPIAGKAKSGSPQLCTLSDSAVPSTVKAEGPIESVSSKYLVNEKQGCDDVPDPTLKEMGPHCQVNDSAVEDSESVIAKTISVEGGSGNKIDLNRIRETFRKRKQDRVTASRKLEEDTVDDEMDSEAWIEKELEDGIKLESANVDNKRQRL